MKTRLLHSLCIAGLAFASLSSNGQAATLAGYWAFDNSANLGQATVGNNLTITGTAPTYSASAADDFGTSLNGVVATVGGTANRFSLAHGIAANGGGSFVNEYTIVVDMFSPAASRSSWRSIYQTNSTNSNDGEYFIRGDNNKMGTSDLGYTTSLVAEDRWVRMTIAVDNGSFFKTYVNGTLFHTHSTSSLDGRYSLDPTVLFFADNDNENASMQIGALAIYDGAMTETEVSALGAVGTAIPEPSSALLAGLGLGALCLLRRRRR